MRSWVAAAFVSIVALAAAGARAQTAAPAEAESADVRRARSLVEEGRLLGDRGDWQGALAKLREAARLAESPGLRFNIAYSEEHLGKLVAALTDFRLARREAVRGGAPEVTAQVDERISAIEPRIATLAFARAPGAERATIFVDGAPLADPDAGRIEVDPGKHRVAALLDGRARFDRVVWVGEGRSEKVSVALEPLPIPPKPPIAGYVLGAAGLVSLGVMGVFLGLRQSAISDLEGVCAADHCPGSAQPTIDRGRAFTGVTEVTGIAGALALAAGVILVVHAPSSRSSKPSASLGLGADGRGLAARVAF